MNNLAFSHKASDHKLKIRQIWVKFLAYHQFCRKLENLNESQVQGYLVFCRIPSFELIKFHPIQYYTQFFIGDHNILNSFG